MDHNVGRWVIYGILHGWYRVEKIWYIETLDTECDPSEKVRIVMYYCATDNETPNAQSGASPDIPSEPNKAALLC